MREKLLALMIALCIVVGAIGCGKASTENKDEEKKSVAEQKKEEDKVDNSSLPKVELGDDWSGYQIKIDGYVYQFPMYMKDILALGWNFQSEDDASRLINPNSYSSIYMEKDEKKVCFAVVNLDVNSIMPDECLVGGCSAQNYDLEFDSIEFPGGINSKSSKEDVIAAYGTPTDIWESDTSDSIYLTYEKDSYEQYKITFSEGKLFGFQIKNFVKPEDFAESEVSDKIPEQVLNYKKPEKLEDINNTTVSIDGVMYKLPFPVKELLANGWKLEEDGTIAGHDFGYCQITKDNQTCRLSIDNYADFATKFENCIINEIDLRVDGSGGNGFVNELKVKNAEIAAGISLGITEEELVEKLKNADVKYVCNNDSSYYTTYSWGENDDYKLILVDAETKKVYSIKICTPYNE